MGIPCLKYIQKEASHQWLASLNMKHFSTNPEQKYPLSFPSLDLLFVLFHSSFVSFSI